MTTNKLGYRPDQAEMDIYLREGEARAMSLGNRGPVRYDDDGKLHPEILEAYWRCGFYVFEGVVGQEELDEIEADLKNILDCLPSAKGSPVDAKGRPALTVDCTARMVAATTSLSPLGRPTANSGMKRTFQANFRGCCKNPTEAKDRAKLTDSRRPKQP